MEVVCHLYLCYRKVLHQDKQQWLVQPIIILKIIFQPLQKGGTLHRAGPLHQSPFLTGDRQSLHVTSYQKHHFAYNHTSSCCCHGDGRLKRYASDCLSGALCLSARGPPLIYVAISSLGLGGVAVGRVGNLGSCVVESCSDNSLPSSSQAAIVHLERGCTRQLFFWVAACERTIPACSCFILWARIWICCPCYQLNSNLSCEAQKVPRLSASTRLLCRKLDASPLTGNEILRRLEFLVMEDEAGGPGLFSLRRFLAKNQQQFYSGIMIVWFDQGPRSRNPPSRWENHLVITNRNYFKFSQICLLVATFMSIIGRKSLIIVLKWGVKKVEALFPPSGGRLQYENKPLPLSVSGSTLKLLLECWSPTCETSLKVL